MTTICGSFGLITSVSDHLASEQQQEASVRQVLADRPCGQRAGRGHELGQPADEDGGRRDQQVAASAEGVHPRAGPQGGAPPLPGEQAHAGAQGLLHRGQGQDLHGELQLILKK